MPDNRDVVTLWRPTGENELDLVKELGWRAWPPRLPEQPIFYPVLNRRYATKIAREWNVPHRGVGFVTQFDVDRAFLDTYELHQVGGRDVLEYWIPAEDLDSFNAHIAGAIKVVAGYRGPVPDADFAAAEAALGHELPPPGGSTSKGPRGCGKAGWTRERSSPCTHRPEQSKQLRRGARRPPGIRGSRSSAATGQASRSRSTFAPTPPQSCWSTRPARDGRTRSCRSKTSPPSSTQSRTARSPSRSSRDEFAVWG